jgi:hypothetical protein
MKNLKEICEKYSDVGIGRIHWGGKCFYEINSEKPITINSEGGKAGFVRNELGEVQLYEFFEAPYQYYKEDVEITAAEYHNFVETCGYDFEAEERLGLRIEHDNVRHWWGLTLEHYFPYPWYPEKEIIAFELMLDMPLYRSGVVFNVCESGNVIASGPYNFTTDLCLENPEYFKPLYNLS